MPLSGNKEDFFMLFFYIRHGEPIYHPDSLTPQGELQADALAKRLALFGLDRIFVSSSVRAQQTAEPTCKLLKLTPEVLDWTTERHCSKRFRQPWDGETWEGGPIDWVWRIPYFVRLFNSPEIRALGDNWASAPEFADYPFAEEVQRVNGEVDAFFASLGYVHDRKAHLYTAAHPNDDRVALFAHQGFGLEFLSSILDIPYPIFATHFDMGHSGMTVINFVTSKEFVYPRVLQLSNDSHLYREGLPLNYQNRMRF